MKKNVLFLTLAAMALSGCANTPIEQGPVEIEDALGRKISVDPSKLNKVVCIGAGALRLYSYVGDMNKLSGVEDVDNPDRTTMWKNVARPYYMANMDLLRTLPSCGLGGPGAQAAEPHKILECEPDIIVSQYLDVKAADDLQEDTGVPVLTVSLGSKACFDEAFYKSIENLGKAFGKAERAKAIVDYAKDTAEFISNRTKDIAEEDKPSVYLAGLGNWGQKGLYDTASNYVLFNQAHIKNAVDGRVAVNGQQQIKKELFEDIGKDLDKMIIDAAGLANIKAAYQADNTIIDNVKAVNDGEVYLSMAYNAYYTNIEIALMDAYFDAASVYPSYFEDLDLEAKCNEITTLFNGKALYDDIKAMGSSFGGFQKIDNLKEFLSR